MLKKSRAGELSVEDVKMDLSGRSGYEGEGREYEFHSNVEPPLSTRGAGGMWEGVSGVRGPVLE